MSSHIASICRLIVRPLIVSFYKAANSSHIAGFIIFEMKFFDFGMIIRLFEYQFVLVQVCCVVYLHFSKRSFPMFCKTDVPSQCSHSKKAH